MKVRLGQIQQMLALMPGQIDDDMVDFMFGQRLQLGDIFETAFCKQFGGALCNIKSGVGQFVQAGGRILIRGLFFDGVLNNCRFGFAGRYDKSDHLAVERDGVQTDGNHQPVAGDFDAAQVAGSGGLGFVIGRREPCGGKMIRAFYVKADMAVRPDAAQKKTDSDRKSVV